MGNATYLLRFAADEAGARRASGLLFEQLDPDTATVSAFEDGGSWRVEVQFLHGPDQARLRRLIGEVCAGGPEPEIVFERVAEQDWVAASLKGLAPVAVGRFLVHGAHDRGRVGPNRIGIEIEAALAFGTGHHGTTQGCLAALDRAVRTQPPRRVLDLGTGTGVLAIAAARALKRPVLAGEIDPLAVAAARANARANRAGHLVRAVRADGVRHPAIRAGAPYDLVLANILLLPLLRLARPVAGLLAPGATVVLSGLLPAQANAALAVWGGRGLMLRRKETRENWTTLTLARAPARKRKRPGGRGPAGARISLRRAGRRLAYFTKGNSPASL